MASFQDLIDAFNARRQPANAKSKLAGSSYFMPKSSKEELAKRQKTLEESGLPGVLKEAGREMYENPVVNTAIGLSPGAGDLQSAFEALKAARQGNYGEAGLNALGVLPLVPSLGGMIKKSSDIPDFENFMQMAQKGKIQQAKNSQQEVDDLLSGKSKFAEVRWDWNDPDIYDKVDALEAQGYKFKESPEFGQTWIYKNAKDLEKIESAKNPIQFGEAYGYSPEDVAKFYIHRRQAIGNPEMEQYAYKEYLKDLLNKD